MMRHTYGDIDEDTLALWGHPSLEMYRSVEFYCGDCCNGHEHKELLNEEDWYWRPLHVKVDMSCINALENGQAKFFEFIRLLGEGSSVHGWTTIGDVS